MKTISQAAKKEAADFDEIVKAIKWEEICFQDKKQLNYRECILPNIVGLAVDYLSRMMITGDKNKAFRISLMFKDMSCVVNHPDNPMTKDADYFFKKINGMDDLSIINACSLVFFDDIFRASKFDNNNFRYLQTLQPAQYKSTVENIRVMVQRCIDYFKGCHSPDTGFCVKYGGVFGDGDYFTGTELCDLKVSKYKLHDEDHPDNFLHHTKQVLLYWYAGLHTEGLDFSKIDTLSIFNPRLNIAWKLKVSQLPEDLLDELDMFCWECLW